ncbi:MAG: hypothetical protein WD939_01255 [Dehalococcoidia bacterium]
MRLLLRQRVVRATRVWSLVGSSDGVINMTDINGVYAQYQHDCR